MPKIEIELNQRFGNVIKKEAKGPILRKNEPEYLPRRLSSSGYIEFYDVGLYANGNELTFSHHETLVPGVGGSYSYTSPTGAEFDPLYDEIFATPLADFATTFKKLTLADFQDDYYRFTISNGTTTYSSWTDPEFTEYGVQLPADFLASANFRIFTWAGAIPSIVSTFLFPMKGANDTLAVHVTATRDFNADQVVYTPQNGDKVFLFPLLGLRLGEWTDPPAQTGIQQVWIDGWKPFPRAPFIIGGSRHDETYGATWSTGRPDAEYFDVHEVQELMRTTDTTPEGHLYTFSSDTWSTIDPATIPDTTAFPPGSVPGGVTMVTQASYAFNIGLLDDQIAVAVQQGNDWYYFWHTFA